jgi:hypothetical protein
MPSKYIHFLETSGTFLQDKYGIVEESPDQPGPYNQMQPQSNWQAVGLVKSSGKKKLNCVRTASPWDRLLTDVELSKLGKDFES